METMQTNLEHEGVRVAQVSREHEQFSNDMGKTVERIMDAQEDQGIIQSPCATSCYSPERDSSRTHLTRICLTSICAITGFSYRGYGCS